MSITVCAHGRQETELPADYKLSAERLDRQLQLHITHFSVSGDLNLWSPDEI